MIVELGLFVKSKKIESIDDIFRYAVPIKGNIYKKSLNLQISYKIDYFWT